MSNHQLCIRISVSWLFACFAAAPISACNRTPIAIIYDPVTPYVQVLDVPSDNGTKTVTLDGRESNDPPPDGGPIKAYKWLISKWTGYGYSSFSTVDTQNASVDVALPKGRFQIELTVKDDEGQWCDYYDRDKCYVYIVYTFLTRTEGHVGMGGLVDIYPNVEPNTIGGEGRLSKACSGNGDVNVWRKVENDKTGTLLSLPWSWPMSHGPVPTPLYVEGTAASSSSNDVALTLRYVASGLQSGPRVVYFTIKPDAGNTVAQATDIDDITKPIFEAIGPKTTDPEDWYKFTINSGGVFNIELGFDDPGGANLDWYVFSTSDTVHPIASKTTLLENPETGAAGLSPGQYYLQVKRVDSSTTPCTFKVTTTRTVVMNVDLDADSDRTGSVEGTPTEENIEEQQAAIVPVNCDDDGAPSGQDNMNTVVDGQGDVLDLVPIIVRQADLTGKTVTLKCADSLGNPGGPFNVFIWTDANTDHQVGYNELNIVTLPYQFTSGDLNRLKNEDITFYVEATRFLYGGETTFKILLTVDSVTDSVLVRPSPFILLPGAHTNYITYSPGTGFPNLGFGTKVSYDDPWLQDQTEIGFTSWPLTQSTSRTMYVACNLPRQKPYGHLGDWPETMLTAGVGYFDLRPLYSDKHENYGGGIEVTPQFEDSAHKLHPLGQIVVSSACDLIGFFEAQGVQTPVVTIGTSWLAVQHIDEVMSIIGGRSIAIADADRGVDLIKGLNDHYTGSANQGGDNYLLVTNLRDVSTGELVPLSSLDQLDWPDGFIEVTSPTVQVRQIQSLDLNTGKLTVTRNWKDTNNDTFPECPSQSDPWQFTIVERGAYRIMLFDGQEDCGVATGMPNGQTLEDSTKNWTGTNWTGGYIEIVEGAGAGQRRLVSSNTATSITVGQAWQAGGIDDTSRYVLVTGTKVYDNGDPAYMTVAYFCANLAVDSRAFQSPSINNVRDALKTGLDLTDNDFTKVPAIYWNQTSLAPTFIPGMVNFIDVGGYYVPRPFGPLKTLPAPVYYEDVFEQEMKARFSNCTFRDSWYYHTINGEIHCVTNAKRSLYQLTDWWNY